MTNQGAVIMECEYFPCWEWFSQFMKADSVYLVRDERFVRSSYRNRALVAGANGVIGLTVPIIGGRNQRTAMNEILIDYTEDWQAQHWKTILSAYRRAAFFEYFEDTFEQFFTTRHEKLIDLNLASIKLLLKVLQLQKKVELRGRSDISNAKDCSLDFLPKQRNQSIQDEYIQVFSDRHGFEPNLSMLDFVFCNGRWV